MAVQADGNNNPYMAKDANGNTVPPAESGSTSKSNTDDTPVVLGGMYGASDHIPGYGQHLEAVPVPTQANLGIPTLPNTTTMYQAQKWFAGLQATDPARYKSIVDQLRYVGFLGEKATSQSSIAEAWKHALQGSAALYAQDQSISSDVFSYLNRLAGDPNAPGAGGGSGGGGGFGGTSAFSQTNINLSSESDAKALVNAALNQYLGRDAKPGELQKFWGALNAAQKSNPSSQSGVSTTTGKQGASATTTTSTSQSGLNAQQFAEDWARAQPGAGEHVAATRLLDGFMKAIQNPQGVL